MYQFGACPKVALSRNNAMKFAISQSPSDIKGLRAFKLAPDPENYKRFSTRTINLMV